MLFELITWPMPPKYLVDKTTRSGNRLQVFSSLQLQDPFLALGTLVGCAWLFCTFQSPSPVTGTLVGCVWFFCTLQPPLSCHCFEQFALGCACLWKPLSSTWGAASASSTQPNSKWNCFWYHKSWTIWKWKILSFVLMTGSRIKGQQVTNGKTKSITSPYILDGSVESVESRHNLTGSSA